MKRLFALFVCFLCLASSYVNAQDEPGQRKSVVDSMTVSMLKRPSVQNTFVEVLRNSVDASIRDAIIVEYLTFRLASDVLYDSVADVSDSDLRRMKNLMCSKFYEVLMMPDFWRQYAIYMYDAYRLESGQNTGFSYKFNDARFNELADIIDSRYNSFVKNMEDVTSFGLSALMSLNESVAVRVKKAVPSIILHALMDYFSYDELASVDFGAFDLLAVADKFNIADAFNSSAEVARKSAEILNSPDLMDNVSRYVMAYRQRPFSVHPKVVCHQEVSGKKHTYSGPMRDGLPHGKGGVMTDKKGITYTGDFRNGQRHGLIMMAKPGMEPVPQVWIKDKLQKGIAATEDKDGLVKIPGVYDGRYFGYGLVCDDSRTLLEGFFVDGHLNGKGKVESQDRVLEGEFVNGELSFGTIRWKTPDWKIKEFVGACLDRIWNGTMQQVTNDGKYRKISRGTFVDEYLEGRGVVKIHDQKYDVVRDGVFVRGSMFGEGKVVRTMKTTNEGVDERRIYEGWLANGQPHGNGTIVISYSNMPDKTIRMTRCGVKVSPSGPGFAEIRMEGRFEEGRLVKGRVSDLSGMLLEGTFNNGVLAEGRMVKTYSDGSSYEGECRNGKYHGHGKLVYADGTRYEGLFKDGYRVDKGADAMADPDVIASLKSIRSKNLHGKDERVFRFENLMVEKGIVRLIRAAGVKILVRNVSGVEVVCAGDFEGEIFKRGKVTISDGNWMEGEFEDGVLVKGRARTEDKYGTIYVGDIKNGFSHGKGKCTYKNGTWFEGNFANGNRMDGTHYTADGRVIKVYK